MQIMIAILLFCSISFADSCKRELESPLILNSLNKGTGSLVIQGRDRVFQDNFGKKLLDRLLLLTESQAENPILALQYSYDGKIRFLKPDVYAQKIKKNALEAIRLHIEKSTDYLNANAMPEERGRLIPVYSNLQWALPGTSVGERNGSNWHYDAITYITQIDTLFGPGPELDDDAYELYPNERWVFTTEPKHVTQEPKLTTTFVTGLQRYFFLSPSSKKPLFASYHRAAQGPFAEGRLVLATVYRLDGKDLPFVEE